MLRRFIGSSVNASRHLATLREMNGVRDPSLLYEPKFVDPREFPE